MNNLIESMAREICRTHHRTLKESEIESFVNKYWENYIIEATSALGAYQNYFNDLAFKHYVNN